MYFGLKNATTNIRAFGLKLKKKKEKEISSAHFKTKVLLE